MIDFCWQLHSRPSNGEYIKDDLIESIDVILDKANVLRLVYPNPAKYERWNAERLDECKYYYSQHLREKARFERPVP